MASLASINVKFTTDLKEFRTKMQQAEKSIAKVSQQMQKMGTVMSAAITVPLIALAGSALKAFTEVEGVRLAFNRLNDPKLLDKLRKATSNTTADLDLMKAAVNAKNFGLPIEELGTLMEFASRRAKDTGQSVDYLVESIVTGIGRKSPLILDNLGISAIALKKALGGVSLEAASVGQITEAVGKIAKSELDKMGTDVLTLGERFQQLKTMGQNALVQIGEILAPVIEPIVEKVLELAEGFQNLSDSTKRWIVILGGVAAAIGPLLGLAGTILPAIIAGFGLLSAKVLLVVGALAAVAYVIYKNWGPISKYMKKLTNDVIDLYNEFEGIRVIVQSIVPYFKSLFQVGVVIFKGLGRVVAAFVDGVINSFRSIGRAWDAIKSGNISQLGGILAEATASQMAGLSNIVQGVIRDADAAAKKINGYIADARNKAKIKIDKESFFGSVNETLDGAKGIFEKFGEDAGAEIEKGIDTGIKKESGKKKTNLGLINPENLSLMSAGVVDTFDVEKFFDELPKKIEASFPRLVTALTLWKEEMQRFNDSLHEMILNLKVDLAVGFGEAIGGLITGQQSFGGVLNNLLGLFADFVKQFGKMAIQAGITAKIIQTELFKNPMAAIAAGIALVAIGTAMSSLKVPQLAEGGVVSGRSLVEVGEYANANINPEVIAPLDKLEGMIQGSGGNMPSVIRLTGKGDELQGVIDRNNYLNSKA